MENKDVRGFLFRTRQAKRREITLSNGSIVDVVQPTNKVRSEIYRKAVEAGEKRPDMTTLQFESLLAMVKYHGTDESIFTPEDKEAFINNVTDPDWDSLEKAAGDMLNMNFEEVEKNSVATP